MDKYAKHREVAEKKLRATHWETLAVRVNETVDALASAGLLREANEIPALVALDGYKRMAAQLDETIANITRERDTAQRLAQEHRNNVEFWVGQHRKALASAASPEVMRVLGALDAYAKDHFHAWSCTESGDPTWNELVKAHSALSASRQPKAQEPLERWCVVDGDCHYTHATEATARQHAKERGGLRVVHLREVSK